MADEPMPIQPEYIVSVPNEQTEGFPPIPPPPEFIPDHISRESQIPAPETQTQKPEAPVEFESPKETEQKRQTTPENETLDEKIDNLKKKLKLKKKKQITIPQIKDDVTVRIEHVMQEGLEDAYRELTPIQQQEFKIKGEETAWQIRQLMKSTHVKIKEIFKLLLEWLRMLPGINRFFLEQEAKIKADKIFSLKDYQQK